MNISKKSDGSKTVIGVEGELDLKTAPELSAFLADSLDGVTELEFDFSRLLYLSSAGMRVILSAQKTMNRQGKMRITHVSDMVMEIFEAAGFDTIMDISQ